MFVDEGGVDDGVEHNEGYDDPLEVVAPEHFLQLLHPALAFLLVRQSHQLPPIFRLLQLLEGEIPKEKEY